MSHRRAIDVLFEFDAPQTVVDLSIPLSYCSPEKHDVWFDQIHPQHSKPSAVLARETAALVRKLQEKEQQQKESQRKKRIEQRQQHKDAKSEKTATQWREDKENQCLTNEDLNKAENKQLKHQEIKFDTSRKNMQVTHEPCQVDGKEHEKEVIDVKTHRKPLVDARNRLNVLKSNRKVVSDQKKKAMKDWEVLLTRHNEKFKVKHTYEPPQHSVREVRQWEREMNKSYYALSATERVQANKEIAIWKQRQKTRLRNHDGSLDHGFLYVEALSGRTKLTE